MLRKRIGVGLLALAASLLGPGRSWGQMISLPAPAKSPPASQPEPVPSVQHAGPSVRGPVDKDEQKLVPTTQPAPVAPAVPSREDVMRDLLGEGDSSDAPSPREMLSTFNTEVRRPVIPAPPGRGNENKAVESVKPASKSKLLPDGHILVDRVGQLVRDRGRWLFAFEADKSAADPPLVLLPNSLLEAMQQQANYGKSDIRFRVSGEVTQYQDTNYLLLRRVLVEYNLDRF